MSWSKTCGSERKNFGHFKHISYLNKAELDFCEEEYLESIGYPVTIEIKGNALNVEQDCSTFSFLDLGPYEVPDIEEFNEFFRTFDFQVGHKSYPGSEFQYLAERFYQRFGESMEKYVNQKWYQKSHEDTK